MKVRVFSIGLLALALCGGGVMSYAQGGDAAGGPGGPRGWGGPHDGFFGFMSHELNLTAAQKDQIKTMMQAQRATLRPIMQQLEQNRASMLTAAAGGAFNQAAVQALATQKAQLEAQLTVQRASLESQVYNQVLTPEQKATAEQIRQKQLARIQQHLQAPASTEAPEATSVIIPD